VLNKYNIVISWDEYLSTLEDVTWTSKGLTTSIRNGVGVPMLQQSFLDGGFENFKIILMGGDKMFVYLIGDVDVISAFIEAIDFFNSFLDNCRPWSRDYVVLYERGAWLRCYHIPIHAWNSVFFTDLSSFFGRLLKIDDQTLNKNKMDYARLLIFTSIVKELNSFENICIADRIYPIRLIEDLEFGLADDACLVENEDHHKSSCSKLDYVQNDEPVVDTFVNQLKDDFKEVSFEPEEGVVKVFDDHNVKQVDSKNYQAHVGVSNSNSNVEVSMNRKHLKKKLVPSMIDLKKVARLSEKGRNALICSLKSFKKSKGKCKSLKGSQGKAVSVSLSAESGASTNNKD